MDCMFYYKTNMTCLTTQIALHRTYHDNIHINYKDYSNCK